jgi:DNA-binding response OmpR family regulator
MTPPGLTRERTILIVEDDSESADIFRHILQANGYVVRTTPDAETALGELQRDRPMAMIIDLHLPAMGGLELLRRIRAGDGPELPVAVVTGDYMVDERVVNELSVLGAQLYFKPLWEEDVIRAAATLAGTLC